MEDIFVFRSLSIIDNSTDADPPKILVTAPFLRPVSVSEVGVNGNGSEGWPALMEAFDNYGVVGARLVAPYLDKNEGAWKYAVKRQASTLAGQMSTGLGWNGFGKVVALGRVLDIYVSNNKCKWTSTNNGHFLDA
jgi:hypothetical protein